MLSSSFQSVCSFSDACVWVVPCKETIKKATNKKGSTILLRPFSIVASVTSTEMDFVSRCTESTSEIAFRRFLAKARFVFASRGNVADHHRHQESARLVA